MIKLTINLLSGKQITEGDIDIDMDRSRFDNDPDYRLECQHYLTSHAHKLLKDTRDYYPEYDKFIFNTFIDNEVTINFVKKPREIIDDIESIKKGKKSFQDCQEQTREDKDAIIAAIRKGGNNKEILSSIPKHAAEDNNFILSLIKKISEQGRDNSSLIRSLKDLNPHCWSDKDFILNFVPLTYQCKGFVHASEELKQDSDFVLKLMEIRGNGGNYAFGLASQTLKQDSEFALRAIAKNAGSFSGLVRELKEDRNFVLEAVKTNGYALFQLDEKFKSDKEIVMEAVKENGGALSGIYCWTMGGIDYSLSKDKEVILTAISSNKYGLPYKEHVDRCFCPDLLDPNSNKYELYQQYRENYNPETVDQELKKMEEQQTEREEEIKKMEEQQTEQEKERPKKFICSAMCLAVVDRCMRRRQEEAGYQQVSTKPEMIIGRASR